MHSIGNASPQSPHALYHAPADVCSFASTIFGKPCAIRGSEADVSMVQNMSDTTSRHPSSNLVGAAEDNSAEFVTIFSYQRLKFQLYRIASPMLENVKFHQASSTSDIAAKVMDIHERLLDWFSKLPAELKLSPSETTTQGHLDSIETVFSLQALALQLAYDNIQILLHKPMLCSYDANSSQAVGAEADLYGRVRTLSTGDNTPSRSVAPGRATNSFARSKLQCWESAIRTSRLISQGPILDVATSTHAASYIGIHLFTSGMVLSTVALSRPLSSQAQHAKQAIGRILQMLARVQQRTLLSKQSAQVLETLVRVILAKEMNRIIGSNPESATEGCADHVQGEEEARLGSLSAGNPWPACLQEESLLDGLGDANEFNDMIGQTDFQEGVIDIQHGE
jgi:hypothetical protein